MSHQKSLRFCLATLVLAGVSAAQSPDPGKFYKLEFVVKEVEGQKVLNTRSYAMTVGADSSGPPSSIRTGSKVPIPSAPQSAQSAPQSAQFNFVDVGVNIDCRSIKQVQNQLALTVIAEVSSILQESTTSLYPVIRQTKWSSNVIAPLKKPTVIFFSDDNATKRQIQLELTVTPI